MATDSRTFWEDATPEERAIMTQVAAGSLKNSTYMLSAGPTVEEFHDLDDFVAGRSHKIIEGQESDAWSDSPAAGRKGFADVLARAVSSLVAEYGISRLAFIEKGDVRGPVGLLTVMNSVVERTDLQALIVRSGRKLPSSALKGKPVEADEAFLIVSDVATTGKNVADAAKMIWRCGGRAPVALVVYDREQGAAQNLRGIDIDLRSLYSHRQVHQQNLTDIDQFELVERDFGGRSVTY